MLSKIAKYQALLTETLTELVAVSLDYSGDVASDIYVYASLEANAITFDPFFVANGQVVERHKLPGADTSADQQRALLNYGTAQLRGLVQGGAKLEQAVPTEIKLHYVVGSGKTDADMKYDPQWSHTPDLSFADISERWQEEIRASLSR